MLEKRDLQSNDGLIKPIRPYPLHRNKRKRYDFTWLIPVFIVLLILNIFYITKNDTNTNAADTQNVGVVYARRDIPAHTFVSANDIKSYFVTINTNSQLVPSDSFENVYLLPTGGFYIKSSLKSREILRAADITLEDLSLSKYKSDALITSFEVKDLAHAVNGRIRAGDFISIYAFDEYDNLKLVLSDVYVIDAQSNSCEPVTDETRTSVFSIKVTSAEISRLNSILKSNEIQLFLQN